MHKGHFHEPNKDARIPQSEWDLHSPLAACSEACVTVLLASARKGKSML